MGLIIIASVAAVAIVWMLIIVGDKQDYKSKKDKKK
jgi:hypothetical protein